MKLYREVVRIFLFSWRRFVKLYGCFIFLADMNPDLFFCWRIWRLREVVLPRGTVKLYGIFFIPGGSRLENHIRTCWNHGICSIPWWNSGRRYEYRQKFLGDDECLVQKKKFSLDTPVHHSVHPVPPDNFSVFAPDAQNEVVGVSI